MHVRVCVHACMCVCVCVCVCVLCVCVCVCVCACVCVCVCVCNGIGVAYNIHAYTWIGQIHACTVRLIYQATKWISKTYVIDLTCPFPKQL